MTRKITLACLNLNCNALLSISDLMKDSNEVGDHFFTCPECDGAEFTIYVKNYRSKRNKIKIIKKMDDANEL